MDQYKIGQGKRTDISTCGNPSTSPNNKTRDVVGEMNGFIDPFKTNEMGVLRELYISSEYDY